MRIVIAQIDPKEIIDQLNQGAITGGAIYVLCVVGVAMAFALIWMTTAMLKAKDATAAAKDAAQAAVITAKNETIQGEKEHSKKVEELLKDGSDVVKETRWLLDEIKNRMPQNVGNKPS